MWFYALSGEKYGPFEESKMRQMLSSGQLAPDTLVWREGMNQWVYAAQSGLIPSMAPIANPSGASYSYNSPPATGDTTGGLIPYKNPNALTGYYVSVGSLIPCFGLILGPAALVLGIKGLKYAKENPIVKGVAHAWVAIVLGSLSTLFNWGGLLLIFGLSASSNG